MNQKLLSLFLAMVLFVSLFPIGTMPTLAAPAEEKAESFIQKSTPLEPDLEQPEGSILVDYGVPGGILRFNLTTGTVYDHEGELEELDIPAEIEGVPVTAIGPYAFYNCDTLTSVTLPNSLENIGSYAFESCEGLSVFTIPDSVTTIDSYAFYLCANLKMVEIPDSVSFIGEDVFAGCGYLTNLYYTGSEEQWNEIEQEYNYFNDAVIHFNATLPAPYPISGDSIYFDAETGTVTAYVGNAPEITIPSEIDGVPVVSIGRYAFSNCVRLITINLPDTLETIGYGAFELCTSLIILSIPDGVTTIDSYAFGWCFGLKKAEIPDSVTYIGERAFDDCERLRDVYYAGSEEQWNEIAQSYYVFGNAEIHYNKKLPTAYAVPDGVIYFDYETGTVVDYVGNASELSIPSEIDGVPVVAIGDYVFEYCHSLNSVILPDGVTTIGESAFYYCQNLTDIIIPNSLTSIGSYAFAECGCLTSVIIPDGVTTISNYAFLDCYCLTDITLSAALKTIGGYAFAGCESLMNIEIPGSVVTVGNSAFAYCHNLSTVAIPEGVMIIGANAFNSCNRLMRAELPSSVTYIGDDAFSYCPRLTIIYYVGSEAQWYEIEQGYNDFSGAEIHFNATMPAPYPVPGGGIFFDPETGTVTGYVGNISELTLPSEIEGVPVTAIGPYAFCGCDSLTDIIFPDTLKTIGAGAFEDCDNLTYLTIPDGVTTIEAYAFYWCYGLKMVEIPDSVTFIGDSVFYDGFNLTNFYYAGSEEQWYEIEWGYNGYLSYDRIYFNATMPVIYPILDGSLYFDSATGTVTGYDGYTTELEIPAEIDGVPVTAIGPYAFYGYYSLKNIIFPDTLETIGACAFENCEGLFRLTIPNSVTTIDSYAFYRCYGLGKVEIPDSVTFIGDAVFYDCYNLTDIYYTGSEEQWFEIEQGYDNFGLAEIHFNSTMPEIVFYPLSDGGIYFEPETGTVIGYTGVIGELNIPAEINEVPVVAIGSYAFRNCDSLYDITLPDSLETIGDWAFGNCYNLADITIPDSVTFVGDYAFAYCGYLSDIVIPANVERIGAAAFTGCEQLSGIWVDANNPSYCNDEYGVLFSKDKTELMACPGTLAEDYIIPDSVTAIATSAFENCYNLTSLVIPDGVTFIDDSVFYNCYNMNRIEIPASIAYIGNNIFEYCYNLTDIYYAGSEEQWYEIEQGYNDFGYAEIHFNASMPISYPVPGGSIYFESETGTVTGYEGEIVELNIPAEINGVLVVAIGAYAFDNCDSLTDITFPDTLETIGACAFEDCDGLSRLILPNGVTTIETYAFYWCYGLESVEIPTSVTFIGEDAFYDCRYLTDIYYVGSEEQWNEIVLEYNDFSGAEIHFNSTMPVPSEPVAYPVPGGSILFDPATGTVTGFEGEPTEVEIPSEINGTPVAAIGEDAFEYCYSLTSIAFPDSLTTIGEYSFVFCESLTEVIIPDGVTTIGDGAFQNCYGLTDVTIPSSVTYIGATSFLNCGSLTNIIIPEGVTTIGAMAFDSCYELNSIEIPASVTTIGFDAFYNCYNLTDIYYAGSEEQWNEIDLGDNDFSDVTIHFNPATPEPCEHDYEAVVTEPTCVDEGYTTYTCGLCADTIVTDFQEALGHDVITHEAQAPTCTEIGWDAYETCSRCDLSTYAEKAALGHDKVSHEAQAPTCTKIGWDAYETCSRCDYSTYAEKAALGHDKVSHEAQAPTCTEIGWDAYETCSRCDYSTYTEKAALGHDKVSHEAQTPTCTEVGWDAYETCSRCDHSTYAEKAALGHDKVSHEAQAPTCTEIGWDAYETCSRCDYSTYTEKAALGHDVITHDAQAPTCTEIGWDAYETCSRCDYSTYTEKAALGHDKVSHEAQAPTCTEIGWDAYETCSRCDYSTYTEKAALGHDVITHEAQAPTCTEIGWDAYETCSRCDYTTYQELPALEHEFKDGNCVRCDAVDPDYEKPGHVCPSDIFTDVPVYGNWAHDGIDYCVEHELMNGVGNNLFNPDGTVSRAQLVTILYRMAGSPETEFAGTFTDVAEGLWYSDAIEWAAANGVVNGVGDGKFAPDQSITREQIATILYRYHGSPAVSGNLNSFPDAGSVRDYAVNSMLWATQEGLINGISSNGVTTLAPQDNATRAQIASIIMRYCEHS